MLTVRGKAVHLVEWKKHSCDEMEQKQETESGEPCFCLSFATGEKYPVSLFICILSSSFLRPSD